MRIIGRKLTPQGYRDLFLRNINQRLKKTLKNPGEFAAVIKFKKARFGRYYGEVRLFSLVKKIIRFLSKRHPLAIVSSTRRAHIVKILKRNGLQKRFRSVFGSEAHTKRSELLAAALAARRTLKGSYFVTDTIGDVRVGKSLGMKVLAVGWGFHAPALLKKARPFRFFARPAQLSRYLGSIAGTKML